ncbi:MULTISPECIES: N,N-dimethylformamidase beta subunit family domain-containing protein [Pseudonocardia]|uniref:N,N-dimethylformamidase beta subunit n=2 Tax=Pseudonocardia TaxID=1847 RepID=A0A1Y2MHP9_PSEAH|nr:MULTISPECIES: N,N-dimethylformamidase beta subunit family domain-containing protein [Pseudonocardia]OSY34796.1 N,N-dimethylformamidase beta subunit [Pseudonocardia autotrophica]TDN76933.1 N,N-dimethylformamidase [Pseudonocardia autotrophica]BBG00937.1 large subunit of N,N-dimethylformamidase [Pseudonocardia autotrophica]GEC29061.1 large subunit of N,N-dimethylformamidase [Pseudonocardia saturnea]
MRIVGYADRLSVTAGDEIGFRCSTDHPELVPELVRLRRGGGDRHDRPLVEEPVPHDLPGTVPGRIQHTTSGSYVSASAQRTEPGLGIALWFRPTRPGTRARPLLTVGAVTLAAADGEISLRVSDRTVLRAPAGTIAHRWAFAAATLGADGTARLEVYPPDAPMVAVQGTAEPVTATGPVLIGSDGSRPAGPGRTFDGAVARPVVSTAWEPAVTRQLAGGADPLTLLDPATTSALDLAADPGGTTVPDRGGLTAGGTVHHLPARGVPGPFWTGAERDFRAAPAEFDAVHLHEDDLADAGWDTDLTWAVPDDLASGVYALKLTAGDDVDRIPVVVTPRRHVAPTLVVLPTWTYLAYANWRTYAEFETERLGIYGENRGIDERDRWLVAHPEFGRSLYDTHDDGSGVCYSSRLRPIVNIRPDYYTPTTRGFRHYAQDLLLLDWLDRRGEHYAVVTDDEIDAHGADLLRHYRVVLTGAHPEYCSAAMLDAYADYTGSGGRLMYLGGNGFYQVTARHRGPGDAIEIRRGHAGVATWVSAPGEEHLAATGEPGGLWRMRGRAPNTLVGVGFTAQGFDRGYGYRRTGESDDPRVAWAFDGVRADTGEIFGDVGPGLGGAAADEFDRADTALGTPADAVVLASSVGHSERIALVPEEIDHGYAAAPPGVHPKVRADVVLFGRPGGGAVFSVGSIGWSTAMTHDDGDNDTARITGNVLDRFRDTPGEVLS